MPLRKPNTYEMKYRNESYVNNYNTRLMLYMDLLVIQ